MAKANYVGDLTVDIMACTCEEERVEAMLNQIVEEYGCHFDEGVGFCPVILRKRKEYWDISIYEVEIE